GIVLPGCGIPRRVFSCFCGGGATGCRRRFGCPAPRPPRIGGGGAKARAATIAAFQMIEACEDNEIAFPVKVFIFDKLVHRDSFITSSFHCCWCLTSDSS